MRRAVLALVVVLVAFLVLSARLAQLQILQHEHFRTLSENNRVKIQAIPPTRGLIFDRVGRVLADNLPSYRLEITPERVENIDDTLRRLESYVQLSESEIRRFRTQLKRNPAYNGIPLKFRLEEEEVARLAVDQHAFPGVEVKAGLTRQYPLGSLGAHVLGYVGRINEDELKRIDPVQYRGSSHIGKIGVELSYEEILRGQVGYQQVETNALGRVLRVLEYTPPVPGKNLHLTIDMRMQKAAEEALENYTGAIVAIDPRNGEIIAMASNPTYDPNLFVNGIDQDSFKALNESPKRPLFNRALRGTYPPGSTVKPLVGLAGLEMGITTADKSVQCRGYYQLPNYQRKFRDWKRSGHGYTKLEKGIYQSCDVYFYDLALNMGIDRMHEYLSQFSLGEKTGIDLQGEKTGILPSQQWKRNTLDEPWYAGETLIAGIGQGYMLTTPLQLAHATAGLAQHGRRFKPRLLYATQDQNSSERVIEPARELPAVPIKVRDNWDDIIAAMIKVVHGPRGTARKIGQGTAYRVAGKTGTAQVFSLGENEKYVASELPDHLKDHALFVAFAPADNPRIALAVIAENGGGGSSTAAPIARKVLDAYLDDT